MSDPQYETYERERGNIAEARERQLTAAIGRSALLQAEVDRLKDRFDLAVKTVRDWHCAALEMRDLAIRGDCKAVENKYFDTAMSLPFYGAKTDPLPSQARRADGQCAGTEGK